MVVELTKALYGCIQSAKLWYLKLRKVIEAAGFKVNTYDQCVFKKGSTILLVYVDDILVIAKGKKEIDKVKKFLVNEFQEVSGSISLNDVSYLGMHAKREHDSIVISMEKYVQDLLEEQVALKAVSSPGTGDLTEIDEDAKRLDKADREKFHSTVMKVQYLAKRVRPDLLMVTSYLTTRVKEPTVKDNQKLQRLLNYVFDSKSLSMKLQSSGGLDIS